MHIAKRNNNVLRSVIIASAALLLLHRREETVIGRRRRWWVHPVNKSREQLGEFHQLYTEYRTHPEKFFQYFRMNTDAFDYLLDRLRPSLTKYSIRKPISPEQRLAVTIRFLATGDSFQTIAASGRMGRSTVCMIVRETCQAIWNVLGPELVAVPQNTSEWLKIADGFWGKWQFPNCIGAIDGKHIVIRCPLLSGSLFYNYKSTFSTLLLAVCDAEYKFTYIDVGSYGRAGDAGVFDSSLLKQALDKKDLNLPDNKPLPKTQLTQRPNVGL